VAAIETTGSGLIAALEQTWADIRRRTPELPEVVVVTGTGLSSGAFHIDAKWGHFGADHWVEGHPTEQGQGAALDLSAARPKPELFVSGECLAEGPHQTLQTMLHEAVHALAYVRGVKDTSRGGKYHNKREFVALAGELGLAWPDGQRPHPVIGFSEVQLTERTLTDYADTLAYLGAAIRLYRDTFRQPRPPRRPRPRQGPGWPGRRRPAADRQGWRAVQGGLRLPAAPVVLDPRQAVHPRADHLRDLRPGLPTPRRRQQHGRPPS
jgi:hypothetical protein